MLAGAATCDAVRDARWYLTGPTASGKSAVAVELARLIGAEIVSMDSMALYRRLDIGTAKPTPEQRAAVPHHLLDLLDPQQDYSLAHYVTAATAAIAEIEARGKQVLLAGGTPLYLKALLRGIFQGPPANWTFRRQLEVEADRQPPDWLHRRLETVDPLSASRLHPNDRRRLVRALEVYELTGQPISRLQQQFDRARPAESCRVFVLHWPREDLYRRIDRRVEEMFAGGLVGEVEQLRCQGIRLGRTASQALGYREVLEYLDGARSLEATIALVQTRTRQYAKRQLTWFRSLSECRIVCAASTPAQVAARIVASADGGAGARATV